MKYIKSFCQLQESQTEWTVSRTWIHNDFPEETQKRSYRRLVAVWRRRCVNILEPRIYRNQQSTSNIFIFFYQNQVWQYFCRTSSAPDQTGSTAKWEYSRSQITSKRLARKKKSKSHNAWQRLKHENFTYTNEYCVYAFTEWRK